MQNGNKSLSSKENENKIRKGIYNLNISQRVHKDLRNWGNGGLKQWKST